MRQGDIDCLRRIKKRYGEMIAEAAELWQCRPEVLAGIMMRETRGGETRALDVPGPAGRGDFGHGHGLMQIDDRSFPEFCASDRWKDPRQNIEFGAQVLARKRQFLAKRIDDPAILERAAIAAYNCGEGNILKVLKAGQDIDSRTAHKDYSRAVLEYAECYRTLEDV